MHSIVCTLLLLAGQAAFAVEDPTESMNPERDALIAKIAAGEDSAASVRRFGELVRSRDKVIATSAAAVAQKRAADDAERKARKDRYEAMDAYRKTVDYEVGWRCTLSPDPAHPLPSNEGRFRADWGKVVRREATRLPPKNELDDGEAVVMYEVAGVAGRYQFRGEKFSTKNTPFEAKVGDLVVLCAGSEDTPRAIPAGWGPKLLHSGFAARIAEVPLIVKKTRWQPIQVSGSTFYWAIKNVQWKFPDEAFLLASVQLDKDAGNGRWEVATNNDLSYLIEIPPSLKHANLAQPGKSLWFILGHHRFDRTLKKLVLVAEDIEEHYVHEK